MHLYVEADHAVFSGDLLQLLDLNGANVLDVYRPPLRATNGTMQAQLPALRCLQRRSLRPHVEHFCTCKAPQNAEGPEVEECAATMHTPACLFCDSPVGTERGTHPAPARTRC